MDYRAVVVTNYMKYVGFSWRKNAKRSIKTGPVFASGEKQRKKRNPGFKLPGPLFFFAGSVTFLQTHLAMAPS